MLFSHCYIFVHAIVIGKKKWFLPLRPSVPVAREIEFLFEHVKSAIAQNVK